MTVSDPWRLTRRDRAACVLALCELRAADKDYASEPCRRLMQRERGETR